MIRTTHTTKAARQVFQLVGLLQLYLLLCLSAPACTAVFAYQAAFLVNQSFVAAVRTFLSFGFSAVDDVFFQRAAHAHLPGVDVLALKLQ